MAEADRGGVARDRPALFDAEGNHVGFECIARASEVTAESARYWMDSKLSGAAARCATASSWVRSSTSASSTPTRTVSTSARTSTAPGSPTAPSSTPTTTRRPGRPTCAPGTRCCPTVRPRSTPRSCTTAGPSWRSSTASTSAPSTTRPTPRRRPTSTTGSPPRPGAGRVPQVLPTKEAGAYTGALFGGRRRPEDRWARSQVTHRARARSGSARSGTRSPGPATLERSYTYDRHRDGARVLYEGPEVYGNAMTYGRALFTTQHLVGPDLTGRGEDPRPRVRHGPRDPRPRDRVAALPRRHAPPTSCTGCCTWEAR